MKNKNTSLLFFCFLEVGDGGYCLATLYILYIYIYNTYVLYIYICYMLYIYMLYIYIIIYIILHYITLYYIILYYIIYSIYIYFIILYYIIFYYILLYYIILYYIILYIIYTIYIIIRKDCCGRPNLTLNMYTEYFLWDLGVTTFPSDNLCSCEIWVSQHSLPITCVLISVQAPRINLV